MEFAKHDGTQWIWCFVDGIITDKDIKSFDKKRRRARRRSFKCLDSESVLREFLLLTMSGTAW
jgi:hypothetical protein